MNKRKTPRITLYTAPGCAYCRNARAFLEKNHIPFQELDVQHSPKARKWLERAGVRSVPVFLVGADHLEGFHPKPLRKLLRNTGFHV